jgi:MFS family permease
LVWIASLVSNFGAVIQTVGASWLMTVIAPAPDTVALVQACATLPIMLLSLPAGAAADLFDRRKVMLAAQALMLAVSIVLAITSSLGVVGPGLLLVLTFLLACGTALNGPAWQSAVGDLVPRSDISAAVSLNALNFNIARSVGPAIGGLLVASLGPHAAFIVNAFTYSGLILVLLTWRNPRQPADLPPERMRSAVLTGIRYARRSLPIRRVVLRGAVYGLLTGGLWSLLPLIARDLLQGGPVVYGLLLGAFGVGAVLGALTAAFLRQRFPTEPIVAAGSLAFGIASAVAAVSPWLVLTLLVLMMAGASWVVTLSTFNISVQLSVPRWIVGRSVALYQTITFGGLAVGSWLWGVVANQIGLSPSLLLAGAGLALSLLLGLVVRLPNAGTANLEPWREMSSAEEKVSIAPESGPVVTTVEYRVGARDHAAFAALMLAELRPIRERAGALRWSLLQDLSERDVWIERFENPTWLDRLRLNVRRTVADHDVEVRALAFHTLPEPPRVKHFLEAASAVEATRPDPPAP